MKSVRKVIKIGKESLVVGLPAEFTRRNEVLKGTELFMFQNGQEITFSVLPLKIKKTIDVKVNIDKLDYHFLSRYLHILYRAGYSQIILQYNNKKLNLLKDGTELDIQSAILKLVKRYFIGAQVTSQTSTQTIIECFIDDKTQEFNTIQSQIHYLFKESIREMIKSIGSNYKDFHSSIYERHDNIVRLVNYLLRGITLSNIRENQKIINYAFYMDLDFLMDKFRHGSEKINKYGCSENLKEIINKIFEYFLSLHSIIRNNKVTARSVDMRYTIKKEIENGDFSVEDWKILSELKIFLDTNTRHLEYMATKELEC